MPLYAPGSFTKNFAWSQHPPGLKRLYDAIKNGFRGTLIPVDREQFRRSCGISDRNFQLIPLNFFLHNTISGHSNFVSVDELVRHTFKYPHSPRFDKLALFALHLGRAGRRSGVNGDAHGAAFTTEYVRNVLWDPHGGWAASRLNDAAIEASFRTTITVQGADTLHKCTTNYSYILGVAGIRRGPGGFINTYFDELVGPALFLAFDRFWLDKFQKAPPQHAQLLDLVRTEELHKLMGVPDAQLHNVAPVLIDEYLALGGVHRQSTPHQPQAGGNTPPPSPPIDWKDDDAETIAAVLRRIKEVQAQIRNSRHVRQLKALYNDACAFCGKQVVVGVFPDRYYSEAAHIKPVGAPHNGPDRTDNMLILCPEHHLQFDRGILRIRHRGGAFVVVSKVRGDAVDNSTIAFLAPHVIDPAYVDWHHQFWA
jgi:hypothetical protein